MTSATHPFRWRRGLAAGAATILLHYALIGGNAAPPAPAAPRVQEVVVELRSAPPQPMAPAPAAEAGAAAPVPLVQLAAPATARPGYKVSLPPAADLHFDVARNGDSGSALMQWRRTGERYALTSVLELGGSVLADMASEGAVGQGGIAPRVLSVQRRGKARTATHLGARITFSASQASVPMAGGAQDKASVIMQLAGIARASAKQLKAGIAFLVAEEKDASIMRFALVGQEDIDTGMGRLATWHVRYEPAPGSYRTRLDVWLAPAQSWYPVQLRSTSADGVETTQTINRIVAINAGN